MKTVVGFLLVISLVACKSSDLKLEQGCSDTIKTTGVITDQMGVVTDLHFGNLFIGLPLPNVNKIYYRPCNMPNGLKDGQKVLFSAKIKYQESYRDGFIIDYAGQAIELTKIVLQ